MRIAELKSPLIISEDEHKALSQLANTYTEFRKVNKEYLKKHKDISPMFLFMIKMKMI